MARLIGYCRVLTDDRSFDMQLDALTAAGCDVIRSENASGPHARRPELAAALADAQPGDTLVVWKLDRLGRSLTRLVAVLDDPAARGVEFRRW